MAGHESKPDTQTEQKAPPKSADEQREALRKGMFAAAFEGNASKPKENKNAPTKKPELKIETKVPGYPNEAPEIKDVNSKDYKKILAELMPKLKNSITRRDPGAEPKHGDVIGGDVGKNACFLVIDMNMVPHERIFKTMAANQEAGSKQELTAISEKMAKMKKEGYKEIPPQADKVEKAKEFFKTQNRQEMEAGDIAEIYDDKGFKYVVLRDESRFRMLKSNRPA
jgi:hypothetical protein